MKLSNIAKYVTDKISSDNITLESYITTDNILPNKQGRTLASNLPPQKCSLTKYAKGDVLIANIRPYLKKIWLADEEGGASNDVLVFRAKDRYESIFLYAVLLQDLFYDWVMKAPKGTQMPRGDKNHIMDFEVIDVQSKDRIGKLLSNIDKKIALNRQINTYLEALARQLYDYWFVQFDFPDANGKPYKSSGGKMTYNEKLKRHIPDGWEDGRLADIANITMGQSPDGKSYNEEGKGIIFYQGSTDFGERFPDVRQYTTEPSRYAKKGDILMSVRAPVGTLNIANNDCCIGRGLAAINSKLGSMTHLYYVMLSFKEMFDRMSDVGTTFGSITKDELYGLPVVKPDGDIIKKYEEKCKPIFEQQMILEAEISSLTRQRDELLPLLMNGQVIVK